jgi:GDP-L-fucose synthase
MENSNILIIGSGGFLGRTVLKQIKNNKAFNITNIEGKKDLDLTNKNEFLTFMKKNSFDYVINCAAFVGGISFGYKYPTELLEINTNIANNLYRSCMESGVKFLVNPISNCAYPSDITYYQEDKFWDGAPHESVFNYGLSKKHMVALGKSYNQQYNFSSANVVLSNMYGPDDHFDESRSHALGALVKKICDAKESKINEVEIWGTGKPIREWLYVSDGAESLIRTLELKNNNFFFNVGVGKGISIESLAEKIASSAGWDGKFIYNTDKPDGVLEKTVDGSKGGLLLNWNPTISLDEGVKLTVDWYFKNGKQK